MKRDLNLVREILFRCEAIPAGEAPETAGAEGVAEAQGAVSLHGIARREIVRPGRIRKGTRLEGLVAKRRDSRYEPGMRSGAWQKMRVNRGQEFVIGGYTAGSSTFDALILGYYEGDELLYAARTRNGFTPAVRAQLVRKFRGLETTTCPFANLPEEKSGRWGQGLTAKKMSDCRWLKPLLVGQVEFLEWTSDNHLRHTRFMGLREDKRAQDVQRV